MRGEGKQGREDSAPVLGGRGGAVPEMEDMGKLVGGGVWDLLTWRPVGPNSIIQPLEDPLETWQPSPAGALCPPGTTLFLLYSLAALISYLLVIQGAGPLLPPPLSADWFGHQAMADAAFTVLLPLPLTWTLSGWLLGGIFYYLDPSLVFLAFYARGSLLARAATDCYTSALQPTWAQNHRTAWRAVFWAGGFGLLLLVLGTSAL